MNMNKSVVVLSASVLVAALAGTGALAQVAETTPQAVPVAQTGMMNPEMAGKDNPMGKHQDRTGGSKMMGDGKKGDGMMGNAKKGDGMMGGGMMNSGMMDRKMMDGGMMNSGMMGRKMMDGGMMNSGMMGRSHKKLNHKMTHSPAFFDSRNLNKNLSAEDIRKILNGHLAFMGNKRLKVGDITKQEDGAFLAEIDTVDDSLVRRLRVDPKTGGMRPVTE